MCGCPSGWCQAGAACRLRWLCGYWPRAAQPSLTAGLCGTWCWMNVQHTTGQCRAAPTPAVCSAFHQLLHVQWYASQDQHISWSRSYQHLQLVFAFCFHTHTVLLVLDLYQSWCFCSSAVLFICCFRKHNSVKFCLFHSVLFFPSTKKCMRWDNESSLWKVLLEKIPICETRSLFN